eukprot:GHVO01028071.1.p1 GENE.GHVO01028071.1~~GHVO01028071.1.p1  ORF type:complete len:104 (+),score=0.50 GHVO01028071.1:299-610(+)
MIVSVCNYRPSDNRQIRTNIMVVSCSNHHGCNPLPIRLFDAFTRKFQTGSMADKPRINFEVKGNPELIDGEYRIPLGVGLFTMFSTPFLMHFPVAITLWNHAR